MVGKPFSGVFDGQGHTVSGLYISNGKSFQGLFGFVSGDKSEIRNLTVSGDVKGGDYEISQLPEAEIVHSYGGKVVTVAFDYDRSTTKLLNKVRSK